MLTVMSVSDEHDSAAFIEHGLDQFIYSVKRKPLSWTRAGVGQFVSRSFAGGSRLKKRSFSGMSITT